jgi:hypothetical protein
VIRTHVRAAFAYNIAPGARPSAGSCDIHVVMAYAWLVWSLIFLLVWGLVLLKSKGSVRREMVRVSLWTMPMGLTEPLFVPEYWNPPSLFDLAQRTGFDVESLIFSFAIGGIGSVLYNAITRSELEPIEPAERKHVRHRFHAFLLPTPVLVFLLLAAFTNLEHIYCGIIALFAGALFTLYCRPDLARKVLIGGVLFTLLYFICFTSLVLTYPAYVEQVWNLKVLTGILVLGIPLEEYLFAFSFGMLWSGLYEHLRWYKPFVPQRTSQPGHP